MSLYLQDKVTSTYLVVIPRKAVTHIQKIKQQAHQDKWQTRHRQCCLCPQYRDKASQQGLKRRDVTATVGGIIFTQQAASCIKKAQLRQA